MKAQTRNAVLSLSGLAALTWYILACSTSFSPDDSKILFPTFDADSGMVGVGIYDRPTARSEMLFLPVTVSVGDTNRTPPSLLRAQWLSDGRRVLVAWPGGGANADDGLTLALLSWGARAPVRMFTIPEFKDAASQLMLSLPLAGDRVLLNVGENDILSLNLKTGAVVRRSFPENHRPVLLQADGGKDVFYLEEADGETETATFGRLDSETFARTALLKFPAKELDKGPFAVEPRTAKIATIEETNGAWRLVVWQRGAQTFTRTLENAADELKFGCLVFSPKGDSVMTTFQREAKAQTNGLSAFGLMEIPLSAAPARQTVLFDSVRISDEAALLCFQASVSHDGKTAAVASTYPACFSEDFKPEHCALFLVDLTDPKRKVTKVPIRLPVDRAAPRTR